MISVLCQKIISKYNFLYEYLIKNTLWVSDAYKHRVILNKFHLYVFASSNSLIAKLLWLKEMSTVSTSSMTGGNTREKTGHKLTFRTAWLATNSHHLPINSLSRTLFCADQHEEIIDKLWPRWMSAKNCIQIHVILCDNNYKPTILGSHRQTWRNKITATDEKYVHSIDAKLYKKNSSSLLSSTHTRPRRK